MPDAGIDLVATFGARLQPALAIALAVGLLLWLLGLARTTATPAAVALVVGAFLTGTWPLAIVMSIALAIAGAVARLAERPEAGSGLPAKLTARAVGGIGAVGWLCTLAAMSSPRAGSWLAAMCGALGAALATWTGVLVSSQSTHRRYVLHALRPAADRAAGMTALGATLGVGAAGAIATVAHLQRLIGPGEAAPAVLAAVLATVAASAPALGGRPSPSRRALLASITAAPLAAWLVGLLG